MAGTDKRNLIHLHSSSKSRAAWGNRSGAGEALVSDPKVADLTPGDPSEDDEEELGADADALDERELGEAGA